MLTTLFSQGDLHSFLETRIRAVTTEITSLAPTYLLNVNDGQLADHLIDKYRVVPLGIDKDHVTVSHFEDMVPTHGQQMRAQFVRFHIPFTGDKELFDMRPSCRLVWTERAQVGDGELLFDRISSHNDPEQLKGQLLRFLDYLSTQVGHSCSEVNAFNARLEKDVREAIRQRKTELLRQANLVASLGMPLKKADNVPTTFVVPPLTKRVIIAKPTASAAPFVAEPTLDDASYHDVLKIIHDTGIEIERHPAIYEGKDEETLRDHFLMVLSPHFHSVSGETFNKSGKTDILIRHDGKNLFVVECGIWKGIKAFFAKIDQLLSYLTWRDSKTAIVCFVKNKDFSTALDAIKKETPSHPQFQQAEAPVSEAWLRYIFALPGDSSRTLRLAVLCFHFP
jgi:hypothetical protein